MHSHEWHAHWVVASLALSVVLRFERLPMSW